MKTGKHIISAVFFAALSAISIYAQKTIKTQNIPVDFDTKDLTVNIKANFGSIKITGYEGKEVVVDVQQYDSEGMPDFPEEWKTHTLPNFPNNGHWGSIKNDSVNTEGLKKIQSNSQGYEIIREGHTIYITSDIVFGGNRIIGFNIKVPAHCSVIANSFRDIHVIGVDGEIELNSVMGLINASDITGSVVANTVNGSINAKIRKAAPDTPMAFSTVNGNIDITLPADVKATFKLNSDFGDIYSGFDMVTKDKDIEHSDINPEKGKYNIQVKHWTMADINGGGPEYTFKTLSGNIYLRKK